MDLMKYENKLLKEEIKRLETIISRFQMWNENLGIRNIIEEGHVTIGKFSPVCTGIEGYCQNKKAIYMYGAGQKAKRITKSLSDKGINVSAYIVSNSENNPKNFNGKPVKQFNKIRLDANDGIVVALNAENVLSSIQCIMALKIENIYFAK